MGKRYSLPERWARVAINRAEGQGYLPNSPGVRDGANVALCAAACIAYAGLNDSYPESSNAFLEEIGKFQDKQVVINAYKLLGLPEVACIQTMHTNDSTDVVDRISKLRAELDLLSGS
jgi:hypothetical protein